MRVWLRGLSQFSVIFGCVGFLPEVARADQLYSVTNLGAAVTNPTYSSGSNQFGPSGNYLGALRAADRATFQAGSFDGYAHPATGWNLSGLTPDYSNLMGPLVGASMLTTNNLGQYAGTGIINNFESGSAGILLVYVPDPHVEANSFNWDASHEGTQTSGYFYSIYTHSNSMYNSFYGTVGGMNDQRDLAVTEYTYQNSTANEMTPTNGGFLPGILNPHLISSNGDISLGSLGGTNGVANALNNANDVVGWSQTASGAQHAFVYSNGTMQDLNLLIPSSANINLTSAVGIDASGRIVAYGTDASGQTDEFLLTPLISPVPEPSTLAVFSLMIAALAARRIRSGRSGDRGGRSHSRPGPGSD
jgi:probable HAF family extracellular repeat protein